MSDGERIYGGAFQLARQLFDSEIWLKKPSSWKIIWIYVLGKVNHQDTKALKRGEGFFNFTQELRQIGHDITYDMLRHAMTYFRKSGMLSTTKSTRGVIVKVLQYNKFQELNNYEGTIKSTIEAQQKHNRSTTINKNEKNVIMKEKNIYIQHFEKLWKRYPKRLGKKEASRHFKAQVKDNEDLKNIEKALSNYLKSKNVRENNMEFIQNASTWFNNWRDWVDYKEQSRRDKTSESLKEWAKEG